MKGLKTTTSSVLAIGLLAASFGTAVAQDDDAVYPTDEIVYVTGEMSSPPEDFVGADDAKVEDVAGRVLAADLLDDAGEFQEELIGTESYSMAGQGDCR